MGEKRCLISVEGNVGVGKSTFLRNITSENVQILMEPDHLWRNVKGVNLLEKYYRKPQKYAFAFQSYVF
jgi:deoxyadenosine/deoxycytidine kinase